MGARGPLRARPRLPRRDAAAPRAPRRADRRERRARGAWPTSTPGRCSSATSPRARASAGPARTRCCSTRASARGSSSASSSPPPSWTRTPRCPTAAARAARAWTRARPARSPRPTCSTRARCISYLTIEHRGEIDADLQPLMGEWQFGCDRCQEVCPWNRHAPPSAESAFVPAGAYPGADDDRRHGRRGAPAPLRRHRAAAPARGRAAPERGRSRSPTGAAGAGPAPPRDDPVGHRLLRLERPGGRAVLRRRPRARGQARPPEMAARVRRRQRAA